MRTTTGQQLHVIMFLLEFWLKQQSSLIVINQSASSQSISSLCWKFRVHFQWIIMNNEYYEYEIPSVDAMEIIVWISGTIWKQKSHLKRKRLQNNNDTHSLIIYILIDGSLFVSNKSSMHCALFTMPSRKYFFPIPNFAILIEIPLPGLLKNHIMLLLKYSVYLCCSQQNENNKMPRRFEYPYNQRINHKP